MVDNQLLPQGQVLENETSMPARQDNQQPSNLDNADDHGPSLAGSVRVADAAFGAVRFWRTTPGAHARGTVARAPCPRSAASCQLPIRVRWSSSREPREVIQREYSIDVAVHDRDQTRRLVFMVVEPDQSGQLRYGDGSAICAEFPRELPLEPLDLRRLELIHTPENVEPTRRRGQHVGRRRQVPPFADPREDGRAVAVRVEESRPQGPFSVFPGSPRLARAVAASSPVRGMSPSRRRRPSS
jgi:hypothetical protein